MNGWDDDSTGVRGGWPVAAALGLLAGVCGLAALASIILLHGLGTIPWPEGNLFFRIYRWRFMVTPSEALLGVEVGAAILLAVERLLRLALARSRRRFLREHWIDLAMMVVAVFTFNLGSRFAVGVSDESLLGGIAEVYIVFALLRAANWSFLARGRRGWLLAAGVVATVLLGAALLMLPAATPEDSLHPFFVDAVFTSTSALCATCLNVRDPSGQWSTFGQAVILCLVQVGGFATMLFGTMAAMRFARRAARGAAALPANPNPAPTARSLAGPILALMLVAEAVGTCGLFGMFYGTGADDGTTIGAAGRSGGASSTASARSATRASRSRLAA